jgi:hypothetical protein
MLFTRDQFDQMLSGLSSQPYLFTLKNEKDMPAFNGRDDIAREVLPLLGTKFQRDGEGEKLIAWRRVASP